MSNKKCNRCTKTVYPTEKIDVGLVYHKICFKCKECDVTLALGSHRIHEQQVYCAKHVPKPKATAVTDSISIKTALNAPKRVSEGLNKTVVSNESGTAVTDSVSMKTALNAPKRVSEGLNKTVVSDESGTAVIDSVTMKTALNAPKKTAEGLNKTIVSNDAGIAVTDSVAMQTALNAPKKTAEGLHTVHKGDG
eukprot:Pgem_evm1s261